VFEMRREVCVIVPVRSPAERNISMFFQDLPFWYAHYFAKKRRTLKVKELVFFRKYFQHVSAQILR
jgi:hypothetical protein